ncbi:hypothetical protein Q3A66_15515 [Hymenobacter sp. BT770]|uniref:MG2 domain-containing protein n=1 Tax=Hymenobacter sp. BT770 TaxID=2886942 RepID=UPI001D10A2DB|nr:MG2 domain-containing protein [Hymenobacter sp. BT770]MCC3154458.1 hypothetical protein [Hymenobacter sp. BT770]MDO3416477.1 hypothetical protein [Hymenobacter sp. BT770]
MSSTHRRLGGLCACLLLLAGSAFQFPAEDGAFQRIVKSLVNFYGTSLPEKAYLHLDRPFYARGETVWFKAYVVEADTHRPDTLSKVLYVDLLSEQQGLVAQRTLRLQGGLAHGDLALPDSLPMGTYQLRAYTSWMRNAGAAFFFTRPLVVLGGASSRAAAAAATAKAITRDVQFFPEGGNLVEGIESEVGFKAVDGSGHGVALQGTVVDAQNRPVATFSTRHLGMGSFRLLPAPGQQYRAIVSSSTDSKAEYPLPASQPSGYSLRVSETAEEFVVVMQRKLAPGTTAAGPALLLAQVRGKVAYAAQMPLSGAVAITARLPKGKFLPGLAHITLFDEQGTAQCERLVFVPNPPGVRLTLAPDKPTYAPHEAVRLRLTATDAAGQPVAGQFSVAVTTQTPTIGQGPTIASHLLLTSDLGGVVEDPGYYFRDSQTSEYRQALNDLLLTQGWRRFVWKELLAGQLPGREFALEQGLSVSGQVLTGPNQPAAAHQVAYMQASPTREAQMLTDATGHFRFHGLDGLDTTHVMLRALPAKGEHELTIRLLAPPPFEVLLPNALHHTPAALAEYVRSSQQQRTLEQRYQLNPGKSIVLGNVNVRGKKANVPADDATRTYTTRNAVVLQVGDLKVGDSRTVLQYLQGRVAGVAVSGNTVNIRAAATIGDNYRLVEPLFLIDGAIVPADVFASYPVQEIQTIDVLNQSAAGLFGTKAYGGVIALHSRQASSINRADPMATFAAARTGVLSVQVPGYYRAREFYAPRYEAATATTAPDPRYTTLYWAPEVRTDATGQAQLNFFTSDATGAFQATAEGLNANGAPMRGTAALVVK